MNNSIDSQEPIVNEMQRKHKLFIYAAIFACLIRLILRSIFVILTESELGIPLIVSSLITMGLLFFLERKGGCTMVFFYFFVETLLSTFWFCMLLYVLDTNQICHELGTGVCENVSVKQLPYDYTRRPYAWWIVLLIPGLAFDITFLWVFRRPTVVNRVSRQ